MRRRVAWLGLAVILYFAHGCRCERPEEDLSTIHFIRACALFGDAYRALFASSADALGGGKDPDLLDPLKLLPSVDKVRGEVQGFPPAQRPCEICQSLAYCAVGRGFDPLVGAATARLIADSGIALTGFTGPEEVPPEIQAILPPPGGPSLARTLFRVCAGCSPGPLAGGIAPNGAQLGAWLKSCQRFKFSLFTASGRYGRDSLMEQPDGWIWAFFPLDDCRMLEGCALQYLQLCRPRKAFPLPPDERSRAPAALAGFLDSLTLRDIDGAASSLPTLNLAEEEPRCNPTQSGSPEAGTFGAVLRFACRDDWDP